MTAGFEPCTSGFTNWTTTTVQTIRHFVYLKQFSRWIIPAHVKMKIHFLEKKSKICCKYYAKIFYLDFVILNSNRAVQSRTNDRLVKILVRNNLGTIFFSEILIADDFDNGFDWHELDLYLPSGQKSLKLYYLPIWC